jgi:hypothetical protein
MGLRIVHFSQFSVRIGASCIEVSKQDVPDTVCCLYVTEHSFRDKLCVSIRVYWLLAMSLGQRQTLRDAVRGARAGEHYVPTSESGTSLKQFRGAANVSFVVFHRFRARLGHVCITGKMHDRPWPPRLECSAQIIVISDVASLQWTPLHGPLMAPLKIIESYRPESISCKGFAGMTAYEASATCY